MNGSDSPSSGPENDWSPSRSVLASMPERSIWSWPVVKSWIVSSSSSVAISVAERVSIIEAAAVALMVRPSLAPYST